MQPFMNVNPSVSCLLKTILSVSSRIEAGSGPKAKGVAGPDQNVVSTFALLLMYVLRFVLCHMSEDGEISSSDRSASTPYALLIAGMCRAGCWQVRGAISRRGVGKTCEKHVKTLISRRKPMALRRHVETITISTAENEERRK
jgi:hypothetical protein